MKFMDMVRLETANEEIERSKHMEKYFNLSQEMISYQKDDPFIKLALSCMEDFNKLIRKESIRSVIQLSSNKKALEEFISILPRLENIIQDRFGIPNKIIITAKTLMACLPVPPEQDHAMNLSFLEELNRIKDGANDDAKYAKIVKSVESITKHLKESTGIKIDRNKAYISGFPKNYNVYFFINPFSCFLEYELKPIEAVAILLHEIGHVFTHLEYLYRVTAQTTVLIETSLENIDKGKSPKETLLLTANKIMLRKEVEELENKTLPVITLEVLRGCFRITEHKHSYIDSEQQADQFVGRFGLGLELAEVIKKLPNNESYVEDNLIKLIKVLVSGVILTIAAFIVMVPIFIVFSASITTILFAFLIADIRNKLKKVNAESHYDDYKQRINRIKLEVIRNLRMSVSSQKDLSDLIKHIDKICNIINSAPDNKDDLVTKMVNFISSKHSNLKEAKLLEQMIEENMENDLHLASARLKILI